MKYFIEITTYSSTTKLGQHLANFVQDLYVGALVTKEQAEAIPGVLASEIDAVCRRNKRLKPMAVKTHGYTVENGVKHLPYGSPASVWAVTEAGEKAFGDNRPFVLNLKPVIQDKTVSELLNQADNGAKGSDDHTDRERALMDLEAAAKELRTARDRINEAMFQIGREYTADTIAIFAGITENIKAIETRYSSARKLL